MFFDLEDYYGATVAPEKAGQLMSLLGECVVWKAATSEFMLDLRGYYIVNHSGLTAYAMQDGFPDLNKAYNNLKWYKAAYANMQR